MQAHFHGMSFQLHVTKILHVDITSMEYFKCHVQEKSALKRNEWAIIFSGVPKSLCYIFHIYYRGIKYYANVSLKCPYNDCVLFVSFV